MPDTTLPRTTILLRCHGCQRWTSDELIQGLCADCLHAADDEAWFNALDDFIDAVAIEQAAPYGEPLPQFD